MLNGTDDLDLDLYFPPSTSQRRKGLQEVPSFVRIIVIVGIVFLAVAFIISVILAGGFEQPKNDNTVFVSSSVRDTLIIVMICFGVLGFLLSSFVWYGHYLRNRYDPKNIVKGPMNIINFPNIDKDIKVNDFRENDLKPRFYYSGAKNRLRNDFL
jgi:magnesium-transporting ATPase (P-type)